MLNLNKEVIGRDSKNKIRYVHVWTEWCDNKYLIHRESGLLDGKKVVAPDIEIVKGKAKRSINEQCELEFNSNVKKYLDKGYKDVEELNITELTLETAEEALPSEITNQSGIIKPMLCKKSQDVTNKSIFNKDWLASRKINGVRCLMYWDGNEIHTSSRGGKNYDASTKHLTQHSTLIEIFKKNPTLLLDLELYSFGKSLQDCSGAARLEKGVKDTSWLEMYVYDCYFIDKPKKIASERINFIVNLAQEYNFKFDPYRIWNESDLKIQIVPHDLISGWDNMKKLHDKFVSEGWEGLVIRNPNGIYKSNARGSDMIKIKEYIDDTFKIIDYKLGVRGSEDMTFVCELPDGRTFKASPLGNRQTKQEYVDNFEIKYKNHLADCKYFELSNDGIPCQPKMLCWRFDLE